MVYVNPHEQTATAGGRPSYNVGAGHPSNDPEPYTPDYGPYTPPDPVIIEPDPIDARSAALQTAADESANKYLTGVAEMATDEYGRLRNIYDLETNEPLLTFDDGKVVRTSDRGGGSGVVGDKGQLLSDLERMQLAALKMGHLTSQGDPVHGGSQFESGLGSLIALDSEGNPMYTDEGELIYTGLGGAVSDNWNEILGQYDDPSGYGQGDMMQDIIDQYGRGFDDWWYDDPGTPWGQEWYDYPTDETQTAKLPTWGADPLPVESLSMGEMKPMYGSELGEEFVASPLFMAGMEGITGIPYQGRPEFGTIEMDVG